MKQCSWKQVNANKFSFSHLGGQKKDFFLVFKKKQKAKFQFFCDNSLVGRTLLEKEKKASQQKLLANGTTSSFFFLIIMRIKAVQDTKIFLAIDWFPLRSEQFLEDSC